MILPDWLTKKRHDTCQRCEIVETCQDKKTLFYERPVCSLGKLHSLGDEIRWKQAWPEDAPRPSDCCGSALNY